MWKMHPLHIPEHEKMAVSEEKPLQNDETTPREALRKEIQIVDMHKSVRAHEDRHVKLKFIVLRNTVKVVNSLKEGFERRYRQLGCEWGELDTGCREGRK